MIATTAPMLIVLAFGCLVLNYFAFRSRAATAGYGNRDKLKMAAVWLTIIVGLSFAISFFQ